MTLCAVGFSFSLFDALAASLLNCSAMVCCDPISVFEQVVICDDVDYEYLDAFLAYNCFLSLISSE